MSSRNPQGATTSHADVDTSSAISVAECGATPIFVIIRITSQSIVLLPLPLLLLSQRAVRSFVNRSENVAWHFLNAVKHGMKALVANTS